MTAGRVVVKTDAPRTAPVATQQIGGHPRLVQKHVLRGVVERQAITPVPPLCGDIRPPLFVRVYGFF